ncbi:ATP-grasp domain-containing protein [Pelovirga terrestris]|uniref:Carboxylate--amine ligase n=1 Tax=Pelovirga terrestris TaxID=2771352 RepID=A0A8J6UIS6_9BACT|nr:carboxylate--amine ligase [Pelovirga terrestris]MBD1401625.1 carboxylate--amine ligase [Pelovirga terrestris]
MNFICISPHFPPNFVSFWTRLAAAGIRVLGIAEEPYHLLPRELQQAMTEYYRVENLNDYGEVIRACGYFTHRYGKIDRIESHNEHWLELDAALRSDFNVSGIKDDEIMDMKLKSRMKKAFKKARVTVVDGTIVNDKAKAQTFIADHGYPVIVKPDNGVGAADTWRLNNDADLEHFLARKPGVDYFMEPFVTGGIETFDGLVDATGQVVFYSSLVYGSGVMESVNNEVDLHYHIPRVLPKDLVKAGLATVKAFGIRERFFHVEYFRTPENQLIGLEINIRPPGGLTVDMFNYANDIDIFSEYRNIVLGRPFSADISRKYVCHYAGRKYGKPYSYSVDEILSRHGATIAHHQAIDSIFSAAIGNYGFIIRTATIEEGQAVVTDIHRLDHR